MKSLATEISEKIIDFCEENQKNHLFEDVSFYALSEKDGSVAYTLEWQGTEDAHKLAQEMAVFFSEIKGLIISMCKETVEQISPDITTFGNLKDGIFQRIIYRFRMWPLEGAYEEYHRERLER